jgi:AraC family transcriptional regulator, positive regulator of tynA and feaB
VEWSAKQHDANRPFGSWADNLAAAFVQLEPRQIVDLPFQGTIVRKDANPIRVSRVTATKHGFCAYGPISPAALTICVS